MKWLVLPAVMVCLGGCSSVSGSAIRTGALSLPSYSGPVAIYSSGQPPPGAMTLGVVEAHAMQEEGTVETLLPAFVKKVAQIGGNVAVIDGIRARFEVVGRTHVETYYYTCNLGSTCAGTRVYSANDELMVVSIIGRAMTTGAPSHAPGTGDSLIPSSPPAAEAPQILIEEPMPPVTPEEEAP